jgi:hypothetical protein
MRVKFLGWTVIVFLGAVLLCPAVAQFGFSPLPGDFTLHYGDSRVFVPLGTSLIASGALTLLFLVMRR